MNPQAPESLRHLFMGGSAMSEAHDIGWAVKQLWNGEKVARAGWNGRNMWLELERPDRDSTRMTVLYVSMKTAQGDLVPWTCSQTDLLAIDWDLAQ
jgi:Protein of unknown function (DUF2829)